jgi:uncharacterized protein (TIGR00730 family)
MQRIAVFCGSSGGNGDIYLQQARMVGKALAQRNISLVYGGAKVGLMGAVADGALSAGGEVIGVFPDFLQDREIAHDRLTELIIVDSMHERKMRMNDLSDGVIALPGGFGTLEELFEMLTWAQLGLVNKPIALLNTAGYYNGLIRLIGNMADTGFLTNNHREMLLVDPDIDPILDRMSHYRPPSVDKWISREKT